MSPLNDLEKAVLEKIVLQQTPADTLILREQLEGAIVLSRDNSGVGFFSKIKTNPAATRVDLKVIGDVFAQIEGMKEPMTFVLFIKNGAIDKLEGATIIDSTTDTDFSKVQFEIL